MGANATPRLFHDNVGPVFQPAAPGYESQIVMNHYNPPNGHAAMIPWQMNYSNQSPQMMSNIENVHVNNKVNNLSPRLTNNDANIVEKTRPIFKKGKKFTNVGRIDVKKLLMSLKSGLLAEATWALDCLNVLSNNESLKIQTIPNISIYLIEYYKCFLNALFDDLFIDTESDFPLKLMQKKFKINLDDGKGKELEKLISTGNKIYLLDSTNYTLKSRTGLPVKFKKKDFQPKKLVDYSHLEELCDYQYFQNGNTFSAAHIVPTMDPPKELIPFLKKAGDDEVNDYVPRIQAKRKIETDTEAEYFETDTTLCPRGESFETLIKRCLCISTIIRNLSFLPENGRIMAKHSALILVLARLVAFRHDHLEKKSFAMILKELEERTFQKENREMGEKFREPSFETLHIIRMNTFVTLSNLSEHLDLSDFSDKIILPLLDGLLHWNVCQSSYAQDGWPPDNLSCQMQALEIITKLSVKVSNMDLILATPPFERIENFYKVLVKMIGNEGDQVCRELSTIILSNISGCDILSARIILHIDQSVSNLLTFIEQCEQARKMQQPEEETSTYILKHAANALRTMATNCEMYDLHMVKKYEDRIVDMAMSVVLDPEVTQILADLVYILTNGKPTSSSSK